MVYRLIFSYTLMVKWGWKDPALQHYAAASVLQNTFFHKYRLKVTITNNRFHKCS